MDIVTVLADSNFAFPGPEFYTDLEKDNQNGVQLADAFRRLLNILALLLSPHVPSSTRGTPRSRRRVTRDTIHQTTRQKETTRQARGLEQAS